MKADLAISAYDSENNKNEHLYYRSSQNNLQTASRWRSRFFEDLLASIVLGPLPRSLRQLDLAAINLILFVEML